MTDVNCWDAQNCKTKETCPAYPEFGRDCFAVPGTLCRGDKQGEFRDKIETCRACNFYLMVMGLDKDPVVGSKA